MKEALRVCRICGLRATMIGELCLFKKDKYSLHHRENICKPCANESAKAHYQRNKPSYKISNHLYFESHRKEYAERVKKWRERNPHIVRAERLAHNIPLDSCCKKCGSIEKLVRHHSDYSKPLEIVTLCEDCHYGIHRRGEML